jgi:hypothetical protein
LKARERFLPNMAFFWSLSAALPSLLVKGINRRGAYN